MLAAVFPVWIYILYAYIYKYIQWSNFAPITCKVPVITEKGMQFSTSWSQMIGFVKLFDCTENKDESLGAKTVHLIDPKLHVWSIFSYIFS